MAYAIWAQNYIAGQLVSPLWAAPKAIAETSTSFGLALLARIGKIFFIQ